MATMANEKRKPEVEGARAWSLVGQLGAAIAGPIVIAVLLGVYFSVAPLFFVVIVFAGVAAGAAAAYALVAPYLK